MTIDLMDDTTAVVLAAVQVWPSHSGGARLNAVSLGSHIGMGQNKVKRCFRWLIEHNIMERVKYRIGKYWNTVLRLKVKLDPSSPWVAHLVKGTNSYFPISTSCHEQVHASRETHSNVSKCNEMSGTLMKRQETDSDWGTDVFASPHTKPARPAAPTVDRSNPFATAFKRIAPGQKARDRRAQLKTRTYQHRHDIPVKDWTTKHVCQEFQAIMQDHYPMLTWDMYKSRFLFAMADFRALRETNGEEEMVLIKYFWAMQRALPQKHDPEHFWKSFIKNSPDVIWDLVYSRRIERTPESEIIARQQAFLNDPKFFPEKFPELGAGA